LNDGQIPNPNVVRVAPGTGYHRVQGNRRASRNGPVSDLPPETLTLRFATFASLYGRGGSRKISPARGDARERTRQAASARRQILHAVLQRHQARQAGAQRGDGGPHEEGCACTPPPSLTSQRQLHHAVSEPTVNGNTVRSCYYARTTVRSSRKLDHSFTL
jgi:hypothetical protein